MAAEDSCQRRLIVDCDAKRINNMQEKCKAAVFEEVGKPISIRDFELPAEIEKRALLCKTLFSTICGSDIHTITGKREEPLPLILGHEIVGEITAMGDDIKEDGYGNILKIGDRISWTIMASCGNCYYCKNGLPQKCIELIKYGHTSIDDRRVKSGLLGGYGEYIYILPGTAIFKVPDVLSDEIAAPANCALSTVINAVETIGIEKGDCVLVQGAGLLGLNACALLKEAGAREIIITDILDSRLEEAAKFGATITINTSKYTEEEVLKIISDAAGGIGLDAAIEVCGVSAAVKTAISSLRIGGRYLIAGLVTPGSMLGIDGNVVTRKYLTIKGIHNYNPEHLGKALSFLEKNYRQYPFEDIVKVKYPLFEINSAVEAAMTGKYIRVGISF